MTPAQFRNHVQAFSQVLAFKFDFPVEAMREEGRNQAGRLLHETTAAIEHKAKAQGFKRACGYSSGG